MFFGNTRHKYSTRKTLSWQETIDYLNDKCY